MGQIKNIKLHIVTDIKHMNTMACNPALLRHTLTATIVRSVQPYCVGALQQPVLRIPQRTLTLTTHNNMKDMRKWNESILKGTAKTQRQQMYEDMRKKYEKEVDERYAGLHRDSVGQIIQEYNPDGWNLDRGKQETKSLYAWRSIVSNDKSAKKFNAKDFAREAQKKYIDLNNEIQQKSSRVGDFCLTENATRDMVDQLELAFRGKEKKAYWRFVKELKPPKVVFYALTKDENEELTGQITVELNVLQIAAIRDRFGRVVKGCVQNPISVTNYIVLEKFLPEPYAPWRICGQFQKKKKPDFKAIAPPQPEAISPPQSEAIPPPEPERKSVTTA